jgi:RimJ/RimL family protein N-acetyltransferase
MTNVEIRPWAHGDLPLLVRANEAAMTTHLGGPETDEEVRERHTKYLRLWRDGGARMFVIMAGSDPAGGIGWWTTQWRGDDVLETGWFVLPEFQGRGIARAAVELIVEDARDHGEARLLTAYPAVENVSSNALCKACGFRHIATEPVRFRGHDLTVNAWALDLGQPSAEPS